MFLILSTKEPRNASLRTVGLVPSCTVMVIPRGGTGSSLSALRPSTGDILSYVWLLLTPVTLLWNVVLSFFTARTASGSGSASASNARYLKQLSAKYTSVTIVVLGMGWGTPHRGLFLS